MTWITENLVNPSAEVQVTSLGTIGSEKVCKYSLQRLPFVHNVMFKEGAVGTQIRMFVDLTTRSAGLLVIILESAGYMQAIPVIKKACGFPGAFILTWKGFQYSQNGSWGSWDDGDGVIDHLCILGHSGMVIGGILGMDKGLDDLLLGYSLLDKLSPVSLFYLRAVCKPLGSIIPATCFGYKVVKSRRLLRRYRENGADDEAVRALSREFFSETIDLWKFGGQVVEMTFGWLPLSSFLILASAMRLGNVFKSVREVTVWHNKRHAEEDAKAEEIDPFYGAFRGFLNIQGHATP